jgi:subtilisin family serine protease
MGKVKVLVEVLQTTNDAFALQMEASSSETEAVARSEELVASLTGFGLEVEGEYAPVPMFTEEVIERTELGARAFSSPEVGPDASSQSTVVPCEVERTKLPELMSRDDVTVWPNSELYLLPCGCRGRGSEDPWAHPFDLARSASGLDCRPYRAAVTISIVRELLGVSRVWRDGFRGQNIIVGIIDEGVNGEEYPVVGGFTRSTVRLPGTADIDSHGSMCAADVLVAAPSAKLYDYPFLGVPDSGGALTMFQEVLNRRRLDGTPHLTSNSYGFVARPPRNQLPNHEVWDLNHPLHRKVREVLASGCPVFFSAGNCGADRPDGRCKPSGIGPGASIHASNSLTEVVTVAAVNSSHNRIGYSSQGPGGFEARKPDVAAYSHFFGNFGPGRPAGGDESDFDSGTSAACPVAAGVGTLLLSAFPNLTPAHLKAALIRGAINIGPSGWDADTGFGVVNAAASYSLLRGILAPAAAIDLGPLPEAVRGTAFEEDTTPPVEPTPRRPPRIIPHPTPRKKGRKSKSR